MGRIHAAAICLILAACQPAPPNPVASPFLNASAIPEPSFLIPSVLQSSVEPSFFPTVLPFPSSTVYIPTPIPRPTSLPEVEFPLTAFTLLAGSEQAGFKDDVAEKARFNGAWGLAVDKQSNIWVADTGNHVIRKIYPNGYVETIAGTGKPGNEDGIAIQAQFTSPVGLTIDDMGNLFVLEYINSKNLNSSGQSQAVRRIRKIDTAGKVSTLQIKPDIVLLSNLSDIFWEKHSNNLYVNSSDSIYYIEKEENIIKIASEDDFDFKNSGLNITFDRFPDKPDLLNLVVGPEQEIYISDVNRRLIWKKEKEGQFIAFVGGAHFNNLGFYVDSCLKMAGFHAIKSVTMDINANLYVLDYPHPIRKVSLDGCVASLKIQGKNEDATSSLSLTARDLAIDKNKNILYILSENKIYKLDLNARAPS